MEIMNAVWDRKEATLGEIWQELAAKREVAKNTVQTLLSRLVEKGWLRYRAEGKVFHYQAAVPREKTQKAALKKFLNSAFGGSAEGLVMALLRDEQLSKEEADRIRALIEQAEVDRK